MYRVKKGGPHTLRREWCIQNGFLRDYNVGLKLVCCDKLKRLIVT
jgi:hypothetical protein